MELEFSLTKIKVYNNFLQNVVRLVYYSGLKKTTQNLLLYV